MPTILRSVDVYGVNLVMGSDSSQSSTGGGGLTSCHSHQAECPQHCYTEATKPLLGFLKAMDLRPIRTSTLVS